MAVGVFHEKGRQELRQPALVLQSVRRWDTGVAAFLLLLEGPWGGKSDKHKMEGGELEKARGQV